MSKDLFDVENNISNYELEIKKARALCIRGQFDRALVIYNSILEDEYDNPDALVGLLRIHSHDFTLFEGEEIEKDMSVIYRLCPNIDDEEFHQYNDKRNQIVKNTYLFNKDNNKVEVNKDINQIKVVPHYSVNDEDISNFEEDFLETNELFNQGKYEEVAPKYKFWADDSPLEFRSLCAFRYAYCMHDTNQKEALKYYLIAIEDDKHIEEIIVPYVYYNIAILYHNGIGGIDKDINEAIKYMKIAADKGYEKAINMLEIYKKELNPPKEDKSIINTADRLYKKIVDNYHNDKYLESINAYTELLEYTLNYKDNESVMYHVQSLADKGTYYLGASFKRLKQYDDAEKYLNIYIEYAETFNDDNLRFAYWEMAMIYRYTKEDNYENKHQAYLYYSKGAELGSEGCKDGMKELSKYS